MRVHMISSPEPVHSWPNGGCRVLCGEVVTNARPVITVDFREGTLESANSLAFCTDCLKVAMGRVEGIRWLYGVMPAQKVKDLEREET